MNDRTMVERQDSIIVVPKSKIGVYLLPLQVFLLSLSGLFVMQMFRSTSFENMGKRLSAPPRRLRQTNNWDHQEKRAVIEDLQRLYEGTKLKRAHVLKILRDGRQILSRIDTIYNISMPTIKLEEDFEASKKGITIVGDIHGDFSNMMYLFRVNGFPSPERPYIFNGDMTDRGEQSLECLLGLLLIKRYCHQCVHLNAGNHETNYFYPETLKNQVVDLYDEETYEMVRDVLLQLPLGAVVDDRIFVVHGGIPSSDFDLNDLRHYKRGNDTNEQTKEGYLIKRSLWSDPEYDDDEEEEEDELTDEEAAKREARLAKYKFQIDIENDDDRGWYTSDTTRAFLDRNHLEYVVRAHQSVSPGFRYNHDGKVITIHSFPKTPEASGAYMNIYSNDKSMNIEQFSGMKYSSITHQSKFDWRAL